MPATRSRRYSPLPWLVVVIEAKLSDHLIRGYLAMHDVALLVMDEAHHARGKSFMTTIMEYFYRPCDEVARPRVPIQVSWSGDRWASPARSSFAKLVCCAFSGVWLVVTLVLLRYMPV